MPAWSRQIAIVPQTAATRNVATNGAAVCVVATSPLPMAVTATYPPAARRLATVTIVNPVSRTRPSGSPRPIETMIAAPTPSRPIWVTSMTADTVAATVPMSATLVNRAATTQNRNPDPNWDALPSTIRAEERVMDLRSADDSDGPDTVTSAPHVPSPRSSTRRTLRSTGSTGLRPGHS